MQQSEKSVKRNVSWRYFSSSNHILLNIRTIKKKIVTQQCLWLKDDWCIIQLHDIEKWWNVERILIDKYPLKTPKRWLRLTYFYFLNGNGTHDIEIFVDTGIIFWAEDELCWMPETTKHRRIIRILTVLKFSWN